MQFGAGQGPCCTTVGLAQKVNGSSSPSVYLHTSAKARCTLKVAFCVTASLLFLLHGKILYMQDS